MSEERKKDRMKGRDERKERTIWVKPFISNNRKKKTVSQSAVHMFHNHLFDYGMIENNNNKNKKQENNNSAINILCKWRERRRLNEHQQSERIWKFFREKKRRKNVKPSWLPAFWKSSISCVLDLQGKQPTSDKLLASLLFQAMCVQKSYQFKKHHKKNLA